MIKCAQRMINLKKKVHIKKRVDIKKKVDFELDDHSIYLLVSICAKNDTSPSEEIKKMIQNYHKKLVNKKLVHYEAVS